MLEIIVPISMGCVGLLQAANLWQSRKLEAKISLMVCDTSCAERRGSCREAVNKKAKAQDREIRIVERKLGAHMHNGGGAVKFPYVETE